MFVPSAKIPFGQTQLPEHRMQEAAADLLLAVLHQGEPLAEIDCGVAPFPALLVDSNLNAARPPEPIEPAQKFVAIHCRSIAAFKAGWHRERQRPIFSAMMQPLFVAE